ncbi:MAG: FAD:protein FMN transferase [Deltaproteobacteria bacterium]|jgi:thiamine biosynthesis lipoprotein|nr:FAD:protein FMN transferase [Deltaproteobacteria bacterium]
MQNSFSRRSFVKSCLAGAAALKLTAGSTALLSVLATPENAQARGTAGRVGEYTQTKLLMGTFVTMTVAHHDESSAHAAMEGAFAEIQRLESIFSRHDQAAVLSQLNAKGSLNDAPAEFYSLLRESLAFGDRLPSFDVSVAPLVDLLASRANPTGSMSLDAAELAAASALVDRSAIRLESGRIRLLKSGMALTLDGIAKGHITDLASAALRKQGAVNHLINAGGDIYASGLRSDSKPWLVAVENPLTPGQSHVALCSLGARTSGGEAAGQAIATSGSYRNFYDRAHQQHHLIDPASGRSSQGFCSITVSAPNARLADALATALGAMSANEAARAIESQPGCAALFIAADGSQLRSSKWA